MAVLTTFEHKRLDSPDDRRTFAHGRNELVTVGGVTVGRMTLEPGWHWADDVKPIVATESCQVPHVTYVVSGRLRTRLDSGEEFDLAAGDAGYSPPGHDAWLVGDESCVVIDLLGARDYAKPKEA